MLRDAEAVVNDFNTGEQLASGRADLQFVEHTDRLRVMRNRFEGEFHPATPAELEALKEDLIARFSSGAPAYIMLIPYEGRTYSFTVKFELGEEALPFTGRADPKLLL